MSNTRVGSKPAVLHYSEQKGLWGLIHANTYPLPDSYLLE